MLSRMEVSCTRADLSSERLGCQSRNPIAAVHERRTRGGGGDSLV